jgi:hypothetical protein
MQLHVPLIEIFCCGSSVQLSEPLTLPVCNLKAGSDVTVS